MRTRLARQRLNRADRRSQRKCELLLNFWVTLVYEAKRAFGKYDLPDDVRKRAEEAFAEHICAEHSG